MSPKRKILTSILSITITTAAVYFIAKAGDLNPSAAPVNTTVTLDDLYCKIMHCATSTAYGLDSPGEASSTMRTLEEIYDVAANGYYGRGWIASTTGSDATTSLTMAACEAAAGWEWFEDGNGDGDTSDPEDGICVQTAAHSVSANWGGTETLDNTYIMDYGCTGSFPNGTTTSAGASACALCVADCYDGRKDLPDQGTYTAPDTTCSSNEACYEGPLTPEVLKYWKGTRLPTVNDFYGFCGYKDGGLNYETGCSSNKTLGDYGVMVGRTDECLDLSDSGLYEWLSEQVYNVYARIAGSYACSCSNVNSVSSGYRFRAVFRL